MKWGRRRKNLRQLTYEKNPDESGGTKIDRRRLPTAPLGVEIGWFDFFLRGGNYLGGGREYENKPSRLSGRWEQVPKKYQKRLGEVRQK